MKKTSYYEDLLKDLKDPAFALGYLNACLEEDEETFLLALRDVADAHGGLRRLAKKTKLNREHLFRILSKRGNPRLETLQQLAGVFGWRIALVQRRQTHKLPRAA
jgi:probable addiction module antidote protein